MGSPPSPYTWVTTPPIHEIPPDQVQSEVRKFKADVNRYDSELKKSKDAIRIVELFENIFDNPEKIEHSKRTEKFAGKKMAFKYSLTGVTAGIMLVTVKKDHVWIDEIAANPGTANAGEILLEYAMNIVKGIPTLRLAAAGEDAAAVYRHLGFEKDGGSLKLDPKSKPDFWQPVDGKWKRVGAIEGTILRVVPGMYLEGSKDGKGSV